MKHYFVKAIIMPIISVIITPNAVNASDLTSKTIQKNINILELDKAIQDAILFSPQLKSTESAINALRGTVQQSGYQHNPEIGFNINNIAGSGSYQGGNTSEYDMLISQTIERGGKHEAKIDASKASLNAKKIDIFTNKMDIKYTVEMLYLDILSAYEYLRFTHSQEATAQKTLNFIAKRVAMAADHETQRSKAHFLHKQAVSNRILAEQKLTQAKQKLALICGYKTIDFDIDYQEFLDIKAPKIITKNMTKENIENNIQNIPDIKKYHLLKKEKQALLALEKANAIPDPKVTAGIRHFATSSDQALIMGVSIPLTIYDTNQGNIKRAYEEISQAEHDKTQAELMTKQIIIESLQELNNSYTQLNDIKNSLIPQAQRSFSLAKTAYQNDILSYIEVLDAQNTLFDLKQQYIDLVKQYHIAKVKLNRLTYQS
jgi:cobalt-zinc-cadmium efflux system outer membrane protein